MFAYVVRRLLSAIPTLFVIVALAFFMMRIAPGGPFDSQRKLPPEIEHNMEKAYNLDKPLYVQFFKYLGGVLRGDFGPSFKNKDFTVSQLIAVGAPVSMLLGALSLSISLIIGLLIGTVAALRQNTVIDYSVMSVAMLGITIPTFVIAPLSILIFAVWLHWLPAGDWSHGAPLHLILPVTTLVLPQVAYVARLSRGSILEVLSSNFVRTAHAKGLPGWKIMWRHVLRASLLPLVSFLRTRRRRRHDRLFDRRAHFRAARYRALFRRWSAQSRLHGGNGRRHHLRRFHHRSQSSFGHCLWLARPQSEVRLMVAVTNQPAAEPKGRSLWDDAMRRLFANKAAVVCMVILAIIVLLAIFGPYISPHKYDEIDWNLVGQNVGPTFKDFHIFGMDADGRDVFVRTLIGARVSLAVGIVATIVSLIIGVTYGAIAGFVGGWVDELMMRFVDVLYSMPYIFFVIILVVTFGRNFILIFVAIGAVYWLTMARIVRGQTLSVRQREFIEAARAAGVGPLTIIARHIVPNVIGPVVVYITLTIPGVILSESFLSFLGLGVQEPLTSWGRLISEGAQEMEISPWLLIFPALFMGVTLFCFNFIGDGLRDALDPKDR